MMRLPYSEFTRDLSRKEIRLPERIHYESLCCTKNGIEKLRGKKYRDSFAWLARRRADMRFGKWTLMYVIGHDIHSSL